MRFWLPIWWQWKTYWPEFDRLARQVAAGAFCAGALCLLLLIALLVVPVSAPIRYLNSYRKDAKVVAEATRLLNSGRVSVPMAEELIRRRRLVFPKSRLYRTWERVLERRERRFARDMAAARAALEMGNG
jgi:hypothetical protein